MLRANSPQNMLTIFPSRKIFENLGWKIQVSLTKRKTESDEHGKVVS